MSEFIVLSCSHYVQNIIADVKEEEEGTVNLRNTVLLPLVTGKQSQNAPIAEMTPLFRALQTSKVLC